MTFGNPPPGPKCNAKFKAFVDKNNFDCRVDSGFSVANMPATPDKDEIAALCESNDCWALIDGMREASPTECVMYSGYYLYADLVNPILKQCAALPANSSVPVATGETPFNNTWANTPTTPPPPTAATVAPSPTANATANTELVDTSAKLVDSALTRGTIIAIISASVFVLSLIAGLVKFFYRRRERQRKQAEKEANALGTKDRIGRRRAKNEEEEEEEEDEDENSADDDDEDGKDFDFIATLEERIP